LQPFRTRWRPQWSSFEGRLAHIIDWWEENGPIFIAAWENIAAAIQWVIGEVIVPIFEWAWPYIEQIYSGVLDTMLGVAKLFASILAGDWEEAGEALVDITKGAMQALTGVIAAGWDAIATGIEWVGQGILDFVYGLWSNIVQWTEDSINQMIDLINGFIQAINSVTGKVGISLPTIGHISLKADKIEAPKIKIPRWSETEIGKNLDAVLRKEEEEEEEEDIDKEFEDEPEPASTPAPSTEVPDTLVDVPETTIDTPGSQRVRPRRSRRRPYRSRHSIPRCRSPVTTTGIRWSLGSPCRSPESRPAGREVEVIPVDSTGGLGDRGCRHPGPAGGSPSPIPVHG